MIKNCINSIINWNYFCLNFSHNFIEKCWADEPDMIRHLEEKFLELYKRKGTALFPFFFSELSRENQEKLAKWVNENYLAFPDLATPEKDSEIREFSISKDYHEFEIENYASRYDMKMKINHPIGNGLSSQNIIGKTIISIQNETQSLRFIFMGYKKSDRLWRCSVKRSK